MSVIIRLAGFSGHVIVDGVQLLSSSASFSQEISPNFINYADIKRDSTQRGRVLYAPGTRVTSGSVAFDVKADTLSGLLQTNKLFQRGYSFNVQIFDGFQGKQLSNCLVNSLTLNGSVGGLITGSLNFISNQDTDSYDGSDGEFLDPASTIPYGYWYSGNITNQINDWSLSYSQQVSAVHLNQVDDSDNALPRYLKVQLQETSLSLTTYDEVDTSTNQIVVATKTFSIVGRNTSNGYSFTGPTSLGTFTYEFQSAAVTAPNENVLS